MKQRSKHLDAYAKGLIAAEAEGHAHALAGVPSSECRFRRWDFRTSYMDGHKKGRIEVEKTKLREIAQEFPDIGEHIKAAGVDLKD